MPTVVNHEIQSLQKIIGRPPRTRIQKNKLNTADAEIISLGSQQLALTTDMISDEIHWGLYKNPFTIGWMAATCSLSDLAAVGAHPAGLLLATHWTAKTTLRYKKEVYRGLQAALKKNNTFLLGGDQSSGQETVLCSTALGKIPGKFLTRTSIRPGDSIYALGKFGNGPALGLRVLMGLNDKDFPEKLFCPCPIYLEKNPLCHAAIDASDGLASTLCILSEINKISFDISWSKSFFTLAAKNFCRRQGLPESALFFAEHGDYQLLAAVKPSLCTRFEKKYPQAHCIAKATSYSKPHRMLNRRNEWRNIKLDIIFNASKKNIKQLKAVFQKWIELSGNLHLA